MFVFVYGTLLSGLRLSYLLDDSEFVGQAIASAILYDLGPFPAIKKGDGLVIGEIYYVDENTLKALDDVEGYNESDKSNSLYIRSKIKLIQPVGIQSDIYAYFYNPPIREDNLIPSGDYRSYLNRLESF